MRKIIVLLICTLLFVGCSNSDVTSNDDFITIALSDNEILVDGKEISKNASKDVYLANDIVYYEEGKDSSYGEGSKSDSHSEEEAKLHSVVHITKAGTYRLKGSLSKGQIAVDLGKYAKKDPNAVVTLLLDNVDITCEVAPAIIFYNVYESKSTTCAGANVELVNDSINNVNGSYVAKIFKEGTDKKLHKYDAAFYSKQSMIINGDDGCLNIVAENEGLGSEMHLTINGGCIEIIAQNDGINVNEDDESIFTMNDGILSIDSGYGVEGDGIDSNGSLIINGGTVIAMCSDDTPDGGIDADLGITINGGTVIAFGRNGSINKDSKLNYISGRVDSTQVVVDQLFEIQTPRKYSSVLFSSSDIDKDGTYSINGNQAVINSSIDFGFPGGMGRPEGKGEFDPSKMPENFDPNNIPNDMKRPDGDFDPSKKPDDMMKV